MIQNYNYRARNSQNKVVVGAVQAANMDEAKKILINNKLTPLSLRVPRTVADYLPFLKRVSLKDKAFLTRQLSITLEAGLTLNQALRLIVRQYKKGRFHDILEAILSDLSDGYSFSGSLVKFPDVFDPVFINVVRSGEATGKLEIVLAQLAVTMEKDGKVKSKLTGAMIYPAFIFAAMFIVAIVMLVVVIPQLKDVFASSGQSLPASTQLLIDSSNFMVHYWYIVILGVIALIVGYRFFAKTEYGDTMLSRLWLRVPIVNSIIVQSSMARFGRLLGNLLSSGVPLLEALRLLTDSFTNRSYQLSLLNISREIEKGIPMSVPISSDKIFPPLVSQMVAIGEQTGRMDEVMTKMAEYYDTELDAKMAGLSSLIEPVVILILGVAVAWLVIAILMPVYSMSNSIN